MLKKFTIPFSDLVGFECSQYDGGALDFSQYNDDFFDYEEYQQILTKEFVEKAAEYLRSELKSVFKVRGLQFLDVKLYTPREYNFESDSIDISFLHNISTIQSTKDEFKKELKEEIEYYLKNIRKETRPGYISLEESKYEDITMDSSCYVWAVLKKEELLSETSEGLKEILENIVENGIDTLDKAIGIQQ